MSSKGYQVLSLVNMLLACLGALFGASLTDEAVLVGGAIATALLAISARP